MITMTSRVIIPAAQDGSRWVVAFITYVQTNQPTNSSASKLTSPIIGSRRPFA